MMQSCCCIKALMIEQTRPPWCDGPAWLWQLLMIHFSSRFKNNLFNFLSNFIFHPLLASWELPLLKQPPPLSHTSFTFEDFKGHLGLLTCLGIQQIQSKATGKVDRILLKMAFEEEEQVQFSLAQTQQEKRCNSVTKKSFYDIFLILDILVFRCRKWNLLGSWKVPWLLFFNAISALFKERKLGSDNQASFLWEKQKIWKDIANEKSMYSGCETRYYSTSWCACCGGNKDAASASGYWWTTHINSAQKATSVVLKKTAT